MAEAAKKKEETREVVAPPEGLVDVGLPRVDGWFAPEKMLGEWVKLMLMGSFIVHDHKQNKDRTILVVKVGTACKALSAADPNTVVALDKGKILGLGLSFDLNPLAEYQDGSVFWIRADKKENIGGGRTMWRYTKKREKGEKKSADDLARERVRAPVSTGAGADESNTDDIPF